MFDSLMRSMLGFFRRRRQDNQEEPEENTNDTEDDDKTKKKKRQKGNDNDPYSFSVFEAAKRLNKNKQDKMRTLKQIFED